MMRRRKKTNRRRLNRRTQKKTRSRQRERGATVKGVTRTTAWATFDVTKAHVNVLKMSVFLNFFALCLCLGCPNLIRSGRLQTFSAQEELDFNGEEEEICSALLCRRSVGYILRLIYSRGYNILLREVFFSLSLVTLLSVSKHNFTTNRFQSSFFYTQNGFRRITKIKSN